MNQNSILTLAPYKWHNQWVFDDETTGLVREAFVAGADTLLDVLTGNAQSCILLFSASPFPDSIKLNLVRTAPSGSDYIAEIPDSYFNAESEIPETIRTHPLWLCPALFKYFPTAPKNIYVQVKNLTHK